jgi:hypothetical protein
VIRQISPRGETMYWIGAAGDAREAGEGTDFHATANGRCRSRRCRSTSPTMRGAGLAALARERARVSDAPPPPKFPLAAGPDGRAEEALVKAPHGAPAPSRPSARRRAAAAAAAAAAARAAIGARRRADRARPRFGRRAPAHGRAPARRGLRHERVLAAMARCRATASSTRRW